MTAASRNSTDGDLRPLRITLISTLPPNMGVADYTSHLVRGLANVPDVTLDVIDFSSLYPRRLYPGREVHDLTAKPVNLPNVPVRRLLAWYNPLSWLWAGLSARGDVVHAQWWSYILAPIYIVVLSLARVRRKRIVLTVHNVLPHEGGPMRRLLNRTVLGLADSYIVHDAKSQALLRQQVATQKEIAIIPHGILEAPGEPMSNDEARRELKIPASASVVLHFGNIRAYKGLDLLLRAFATVRHDVPDALLLIAGNPWEDWAHYQALIDELKIGSAVRTYLEFVPAEQVRALFTAADVVALPYTHFDAQSGVGARALYHGKALIVSDVGGLPELVEDERAIVPAGDAERLAEAITAVLTDSALRQRLERQSAKRAGELQWDTIAKTTAGYYDSMLSGRSEASNVSAEDTREGRYRAGGTPAALRRICVSEEGPTEGATMSLVQSRVAHYKQLLHFAKHRFEPGEYSRMRRYFANLLVHDLREDVGYTVKAKTVLEVGGDSGEFSAFLQSYGASCVSLEYRSDVATRGCFKGTVIGDGTSMPFEDNAFDFVLCRGVIEHVPTDLQERLVRECFRVTKEGGLCLLNTSPWYSPFAGHALRPFHLLPFSVAKLLKRLLGAKDLNDVSSFEELCLYPITMRRLEALIRRTGFATLAIRDYHLRVHWFTKIPLAREALTQSVTYLLRKDAGSPSKFTDESSSRNHGDPLERTTGYERAG